MLRGRPDLTEYVKPYAGFTIRVVQPGSPPGCTTQSRQQDFLILMGECILVIEDQERHLRTWDFVHCPPMTVHTFVATGTGPCVNVATGNRATKRVCPRSEVAPRYGAGSEVTTADPSGAGDGRSSAQSAGTNSHGLNCCSPHRTSAMALRSRAAIMRPRTVGPGWLVVPDPPAIRRALG